uniref:Uncharacterized protein n=1 Tax=Oryza brachyantha TaxID=4533 RepID=J3LCP7_ORYBR
MSSASTRARSGARRSPSSTRSAPPTPPSMWTPTCLALSSSSFPVARIGMGFVMWSTRVCTRLLVELASSGGEHKGLIV